MSSSPATSTRSGAGLLTALAAGPDSLGAAESPVAVEQVWTGTTAAYRVRIGDAEALLTAEQFASLTDGSVALREHEDAYIEDRRRSYCPPTRFGLVADKRVPSDEWRFALPDCTTYDPFVGWKEPDDYGWSTDPHGGRWKVWLPLAGYVDSEPLATAAWDDTDGIRDLCTLVGDSEACWTLLALSQPDAVTAHNRAEADAARMHAEEKARPDTIRQCKAVWPLLCKQVAVSGEAIRGRLRTARVAISEDHTLTLQSLPMNPTVLLADPGVAGRLGFTSRFIDVSACVGDADKADKGYPVVGWRLLNVKDRPWAQDPTVEQETDQAQQVAAALARGYRVVYRADGWWVVRDEQAFDVAHTALQATGIPFSYGHYRTIKVGARRR